MDNKLLKQARRVLFGLAADRAAAEYSGPGSTIAGLYAAELLGQERLPGLSVNPEIDKELKRAEMEIRQGDLFTDN